MKNFNWLYEQSASGYCVSQVIDLKGFNLIWISSTVTYSHIVVPLCQDHQWDHRHDRNVVLLCKWSYNKGSIEQKITLWYQNIWPYDNWTGLQGGLKIYACKIEGPLFLDCDKYLEIRASALFAAYPLPMVTEVHCLPVFKDLLQCLERPVLYHIYSKQFYK